MLGIGCDGRIDICMTDIYSVDLPDYQEIQEQV